MGEEREAHNGGTWEMKGGTHRGGHGAYNGRGTWEREGGTAYKGGYMHKQLNKASNGRRQAVGKKISNREEGDACTCTCLQLHPQTQTISMHPMQIPTPCKHNPHAPTQRTHAHAHTCTKIR